MIRLAEITGFAILACLLHVGLWVGIGQSGSDPVDNSPSEPTVSLIASNTEIAQLVAAWTRPIVAAQDLGQMPDVAAPAAVPPPMPDIAFSDPSPRAPQSNLRTTATLPTSSDPLPDADKSSDKPALVKAAPNSSPRPVSRPQRTAPAKARSKPTPQKPNTPSATARRSAPSTGAGTPKPRAPTPIKSTGISKAAEAKLVAQWGASIRNRVERRKRYPSGTRSSGTTLLRLTVARKGGLVAISVVRSSGDKALDRAAISAVQRARYPAAPRGLSRAQYKFNLPLTFSRG